MGHDPLGGRTGAEGEMKLASVNVGTVQTIEGVKAGETGIYKLPVEGPVRITREGLAGDAICDRENHGGTDQAVYVYSQLDYEWWSEFLGCQCGPGTFGENLTISDLESSTARIGDRYLMGPAVLEVTAPRIPCETLARRMGDRSFAKRFRAAERPGLYCRVQQPGYVTSGDLVTFERNSGETVTALELFQEFYSPQSDEATLHRHLAAPIAIRDRLDKERQLAELLAGTIGL